MERAAALVGKLNRRSAERRTCGRTGLCPGVQIAAEVSALAERPLGVEPQGAVDRLVGAWAREVLADEVAARVPAEPVGGLDEVLHLGVRAVEEGVRVGLEAVVALSVRFLVDGPVPVVAGEHLVGALPGLDDLDVPLHLLGKQVEGDGVVADHRLAHRRNRAVECGKHPVGPDLDLGVVGRETVGDELRVGVLVARAAADLLEADVERLQVRHARLGEQRDDQAGVEAAREQHADGYVGDHPPPDRRTQRLDHGVAPVAGLHPLVAVIAAEVGQPVGVPAPAAVALDEHVAPG